MKFAQSAQVIASLPTPDCHAAGKMRAKNGEQIRDSFSGIRFSRSTSSTPFHNAIIPHREIAYRTAFVHPARICGVSSTRLPVIPEKRSEKHKRTKKDFPIIDFCLR